MMTQRDAILKHLEDGEDITSLEALNLYGCLRLAAVIHILREEGVDIHTEMVDVNEKTIARYSLRKVPKQVEQEQVALF